jgi:hypothetical protein
MKNTKHKKETHMAKIQMPVDLWEWVNSEPGKSATKFVVKNLQDIRDGNLIHKSVSEDIIRTKEAEVRGAMEMAKGVIGANRPKAASASG